MPTNEGLWPKVSRLKSWTRSKDAELDTFWSRSVFAQTKTSKECFNQHSLTTSMCKALDEACSLRKHL